MRGLDPDAFSVEDLTAIYLGVSSYIGEGRGKQDQRGSKLSRRTFSHILVFETYTQLTVHAIDRDTAADPDDRVPSHTLFSCGLQC